MSWWMTRLHGDPRGRRRKSEAGTKPSRDSNASLCPSTARNSRRHFPSLILTSLLGLAAQRCPVSKKVITAFTLCSLDLIRRSPGILHVTAVSPYHRLSVVMLLRFLGPGI